MLQNIIIAGGIVTATFQNIQVRATITAQPQKGNLKRSKIATLYVQMHQTILAHYQAKSWEIKPYPASRQTIDQICTEINNLAALTN